MCTESYSLQSGREFSSREIAPHFFICLGARVADCVAIFDPCQARALPQLARNGCAGVNICEVFCQLLLRTVVKFSFLVRLVVCSFAFSL